MITREIYEESQNIIKLYNEQNEYIFKFGKYKDNTFGYVMENHPNYIMWLLKNVKRLDPTLNNLINCNIDYIRELYEEYRTKHILI